MLTVVTIYAVDIIKKHKIIKIYYVYVCMCVFVHVHVRVRTSHVLHVEVRGQLFRFASLLP